MSNARASAESLLAQSRGNLEKFDYQRIRSVCGPIPSDGPQGLLDQTTGFEDGAGHVGKLGHVLSHTSFGDLQAGQTDPEEACLKIGVWMKNESTRSAGELKVTIVQNSDGTYGAYPMAAY